ncbi:MAG: DEAD/DEAH box helicase [bacterium]
MKENKSLGFELLHPLIQKWIYNQGWIYLRDIQETSIQSLVYHSSDIIITANTASGKTEAAYLPILSEVLNNPNKGIRVLYISPLKALINDQYIRLEQLCEFINIPITPWHGDISSSKKKNLIKNPEGILLITPESLEAIIINYGNRVINLFEELSYVILDEMHTFLDTERGKQVQSLLCRLDYSIGRKVRKIGLSATIGDMDVAKNFINNKDKDSVIIIESKKMIRNIQLQIRGYKSEANDLNSDDIKLDNCDNCDSCKKNDIASDIFKIMRGTDNLIFANTKSNVEYYGNCLRTKCSNFHLPQEFYVHHGNLSKEIRYDVEQKLKSKDLPVNVICTSTLELGIDIGSVKSIAQIGNPLSISSMQQRLGRSGRNDGDPSILRIFLTETIISKTTNIQDEIRSKLFQTVAMVELMIKGWIEPPNSSVIHLSTFIHQLLSLISQYGGIKANLAYKILVESGTFNKMNQFIFIDVLKELGNKKLINQMSDGTLIHGEIGEKIANHYSFFIVFSTSEEYRLIANNKVIGSIPIKSIVQKDSYLIFGGMRWLILKIDDKQKTIELKKDKGGKPPQFDSDYGILIHDNIRKEMLRLYSNEYIPKYLNKQAIEFYLEGKQNFIDYNLLISDFIIYPSDLYFFPWVGDKIMNTLVLLLINHGLKALNEGICIHICNTNIDNVYTIFKNILSNAKIIDNQELIKEFNNPNPEKFEKYLSSDLQKLECTSKYLDFEGTFEYLKRYLTKNHKIEISNE